MIKMNYLIVSFFVFTSAFGSQLTFARSVSELQSSLQGYRVGAQENRVMLETLHNRLEGYKVKKVDAQAKLAETEVAFVLAKENLDKAKAEAEYRKVDIKQVERRYAIVEKGYLARKARLVRVERRLSDIEDEISEVEEEDRRLEKMISEFVEAIDLKKKLSAQYKFEEQQNRLKEQALLSDILEKKRLAAIEVQAAKAALLKNAEVSAAENLAVNVGLKNTLNPQQRRARREIERLNRITKGADKSEIRHYLELILEVDGEQVEELEFLGNDQFYSEVTLSGGGHSLTINSFTFPVVIPKGESGDVFFVIYSSNGKQRGRLVFFNKSLLADNL